jgi:hypothetical protein
MLCRGAVTENLSLFMMPAVDTRILKKLLRLFIFPYLVVRKASPLDNRTAFPDIFR